MIRTSAKLRRAVFAAGVAVAIAPVACAQLAALDKGHQLLVNNGLQIWGLDQGASGFNYNNLANANFNGVIWSFGVDASPHPKLSSLASGQKWGKWMDPNVGPASALDAFETSRKADLIALQVGDEQQSDLENPNGVTKAWLQSAQAGNYFPNQLIYVNSFFINSDAAYATFIGTANPDAISFDAYPFDSPYGSLIFPNNWLSKAGQFRRHALGSFIAPGGNAPRPYGLYLQTYASSSEGTRDPGDVEMRWQQFTAWTMGFTFVDAFTVGGSSSLFNGGNMSSPTEPRYSQFKETARQGRNLGPALTHLISYGYGPSIAVGKNAAGAANPVPSDWLPFNKSNAPPNQQYLTSVSATNIGTKNNGQPGDVYVGFFNPLLASYGDPAGTAYFMVTNALGPYLDDPTATVADCLQQITLDFDFGASTINSLQRLRRSDGQVEVVPLAHLLDNKYRLTFDLEGGTGDLFKFNDGSPFVGVQLPAATGYWDNDGLAANNNLVTGAGLGGSGNWDVAASKWYDGASEGTWTAGDNAIFWGSAGTVTLAAPQSASSLTFKTTGYTVAGSTLTMTGSSTAVVDAGATATISSVVAGSAGLVKNGPGMLNLAVSNSFTGGTTINGGALGIVSGALGANPASHVVNIAINNGAILRFNQNNLTLTAQRQIALGAGGGVIDTAFDNGVAGSISGGTLTKTGVGTLTLSATNSHVATVVNGGAIIIASDGNLGAVPGSFTAGNLTLDGGTFRFGANFDLSNNRGITLGASGGTIDTQGFSNQSGYNAFQGGFRGPGDLTKLGSGTFFAAAPGGGLNVNWKGRLIIKEGVWKIVATDGLPYNAPAADGLQPAQVTMDGGTWQIGASVSATSARRGVTIAAGGGTIDTQSFNLTWAGPWAGSATSAVLNKIGSGMLRLNSGTLGPGTYAGILNVNAGALQLDGGTAMGDLAAINLANTAGVAMNVTGSVGETIGSLAGGGGVGGNATLSVSLTTGGNNGSTTFNGLVSGAGGLTKTGSGTFTLAPLSGGNTYGGGTKIDGGTLLVNNTTGSGVGGGDVTVNAGGTLGGTGAIQGNVISSGSLAPGSSTGTLHIGGNYTQAAGGKLQIEIGGASPGAQDLAEIAGSAVLGGQLQLALLNGFVPSAANTFTILSAGGLSGAFANVANGQRLSTVDGLRSFIVNFGPGSPFNPNQIVLSSFQAGADFDENGEVDGTDLAKWRMGFGTHNGAAHMQGDADGDHDVDGADFLVWQRQFGSPPPAISADVPVPEPTTCLLFIVATAGIRRMGGQMRLVRKCQKPFRGWLGINMPPHRHRIAVANAKPNDRHLQPGFLEVVSYSLSTPSTRICVVKPTFLNYLRCQTTHSNCAGA